MVKSKRNKVVPLTKVKKSNKPTGKKDKLIEKVEACIDTYDYVYAFRYKNMTAMPMQELRKYFSTATYSFLFNF